MSFELGQQTGRDQLGAAFIFVNQHNETAAEKWDVKSVAPTVWEIVVAAVPDEKQIKEARIAELQKMLADTDYKARKYIDGEYTAEEYEVIKADAKAWRAEIRKLEQELGITQGA